MKLRENMEDNCKQCDYRFILSKEQYISCPKCGHEMGVEVQK
jgi:Zn finger protein HypA/HybF involved in hydrogenase expression